jgi:hypothetical protein
MWPFGIIGVPMRYIRPEPLGNWLESGLTAPRRPHTHTHTHTHIRKLQLHTVCFSLFYVIDTGSTGPVTNLGVACLPFTLTLTLAVPTYP